jgi:subtilisin family serine protease
MADVTECTHYPRTSDAAVDQQLAAWRRLRTDHRRRRTQLARLRDARAARSDLVQFDVLADGDRSEVLAVRGELLVRVADAGSSAVAALVADWRLRAVPVPELDGRVVRLVGAAEPGRTAALLADAARRGLPVAADHLTPMGGIVMKGGSAPAPVASGPVFPGGSAAGPVVAVLDTGVHAAPRSDGWLAGITGDGIGAVDDDLDPGTGHGTFAAGIVQQVAPDARVRAYRVMDSTGLGTEVAVAAAMVRAADEGADILNLSLGTQTVGDRAPVALEVALELLAERHPEVLVVAAAGNDGDTRPCWPAAFPDVVSVAGLDAELRPGDWSTRGDWVTCSTVGEGVVSTYVPGRHGEHEYGPDAWAAWTGTSFAAPQVAGAVAARCAAEPGSTPREALADLLTTGHPVPGHGRALPLR